MPRRDRKQPSLTEDGQRRRSLHERRLADQLRQNLLRRKSQSRARDAQGTGDPEPARPAGSPSDGDSEPK